MDVEVKRKWVAALRSGKYQQGERQLLDTKGKYCCLGVLCEVGGQSLKPGAVDGYSFCQDALGLSANEGLKPLWYRNDGVGKFTTPWTFPQIADWIEENL